MINAIRTNFDEISFYAWLAIMAIIFLLSGTLA
jgi:hypothetical protein